MGKRFSFRNRILSFKYAFDGFRSFIKEEANLRMHIVMSLIVIILGFVFKINTSEWISICFAIGLVISMEAINTAIENLADFVCSEKNELIKKVKDISAFAVLFCAIIAVVIGLLIFTPKILDLINL